MFTNNNQTTKENVLTIKTIHMKSFRTLIQYLKDILTESNIIFEPCGMSIIDIDNSHSSIVNLFIN